MGGSPAVQARLGPRSRSVHARPEQLLKRAITCYPTFEFLDLTDLALGPWFLRFSAIPLALLEGNLVLLFWAGGNATGERKWSLEKKKQRGWADGGRKGSRMGNGQKGEVQHEDFPRGHPS